VLFYNNITEPDRGPQRNRNYTAKSRCTGPAGGCCVTAPTQHQIIYYNTWYFNIFNSGDDSFSRVLRAWTDSGTDKRDHTKFTNKKYIITVNHDAMIMFYHSTPLSITNIAQTKSKYRVCVAAEIFNKLTIVCCELYTTIMWKDKHRSVWSVTDCRC